MRPCFATLLVLAAFLPAACADDVAAVAPAQPVPVLGGNAWQIAAYLVGLLMIFVGGVWLLRKGLPAMQRNKGERKLNITETRGLGGRQFLVVAEYENRKVLLGVCPGRIDYLCALSVADAEFPKIAPEKLE